MNLPEDEAFDDEFWSHPNKPLRVHVNGVMTGTRKRTALKIADTAALFHDVGKLNPNFQPKVKGGPAPTGYSSHAYLSAHAFLAFCSTNGQIAKEFLGVTSQAHLFSILSIIAHHHGNLTDFREVLKQTQREELAKFLADKPRLPASDFLRLWLPTHKSFDILEPRFTDITKKCAQMPDKVLEQIADRLGFFQETQFGFAALIESDKRDAGNNKWFRREDQSEWARAHFANTFDAALPHADENDLNKTRTKIRNEAVANLRKRGDKQRVFSITAPTGSGKTFTLLALANLLRESNPNHSICYGLPFLAITEQVEDICRNTIFKDNPDFVTRIDSRARDPKMEKLLADLEEEPEKIAELLNHSFSQETFDAAFSITTFVQIFETLMSNRGASLLRLPNFGKCIFLLDEIQALPPRLYVFLTAYLQAFCERFDSYVVLSTATMPSLSLPSSDANAQKMFSTYEKPLELLDFDNYYSLPIFDRYVIKRLDENEPEYTLSNLADVLRKTETSSLVILNTIDDTKNLYKLLCPYGPVDDVRLLNTRFVLDDRRATIEYCKKRLSENERIILISTALIEAGVDIDFPAVYRDLCPLPNLIQSAGRCNRNNRLKPEKGTVWLFTLRDDEGKRSADRIYREPSDKWILDFTATNIASEVSEKSLINVQRKFFDAVNQTLAFGDHPLRVDKEYTKENLVHQINQANFQVVGSFRLINEKEFGQEYRFYVPIDSSDNAWEELDVLIKDNIGRKTSFAEHKKFQTAVDTRLRGMSGRVVTVRLYQESDAPPAVQRRDGTPKEVCGLRKLCLPKIDYSTEVGLKTGNEGAAIL